MTEHRLRPGRIVFICLVGVSILLRVAGVLKSIAGIDAAVFITLIGGSGIFYEAFAGLLRRRISADLAVSIAALAALYIGESLAAAEVILIMLVGGALERAATAATYAVISAVDSSANPTFRRRVSLQKCSTTRRLTAIELSTRPRSLVR